MKLLSALKVPVLYVNPPTIDNPALIEEVTRAGGLGIIDHATAGPARITPHLPHGVRIRLDDLKTVQEPAAVIISLEDAERIAELAPDFFAQFAFPVLAEVADASQAKAAEKAGATSLIAKGHEGPGWVSETGGFVLLQEILVNCALPVFLQGGIDFRTAAGAIAAGASGIVLDVHLSLMPESGLDASIKDLLRPLNMPATTILAESAGTPLRVYSRVATKITKELKKSEDTLHSEDFDTYREQLRTALRAPIKSLDTGDVLFPLSDDIVFAKRVAKNFGNTRDIIAEFGRRCTLSASSWPFTKDSRVCLDHTTGFPLVQGPMAHVSDSADFLAAVAEQGALPFIAMGNMPPPIAREGISLAREKTKGKFGVGLIGLEINRKNYEPHLEIMAENPPPYAILAAGSVDLAKRIEAIGTRCYLHCPSPAILSEGLKAGLRRFVFEGCESGGHIGTFGSLSLWSANLNELEAANAAGIPLSEVSVLLAGGIGSGRASAFVAGMVADLVEKGLNVGLQMGTAYLTTKEAVSTCAITQTYQDLIFKSQKTAVVGRTVNIRARAANSPMAAQMLFREHERIRNGVALTERKEQYEKDNLGALRLASKGCAIDPKTATWDCPVFCDLTPEEQLDRGLYLMGQVVSVLGQKQTIAEFHAEIVENGRKIFEKASQTKKQPDAPEEEVSVQDIEVTVEREPIAVVGIGLRFPGAANPDSFWENIKSKKSGIVDVPSDRWGDPNLYYDPDPKAPDKTYSRIGGFVTDFQFDPLKHRIPPAVAALMDRTQQLAVACTGDALADARLTPEQLKGRRVGIVLGNSMGGQKTDLYAERVSFPRALACLGESFDRLGLDPNAKQQLMEDFKSKYLSALPPITEDSLPGELANVISGRVANVFNLEGPNFTVDAACASSMAAMMNAVSALRDESVDLAIAGGVDAAMHPSSFVKFSKVGALSPDGSRPFDVGANGFVMGEGAGIMVLKRLSDAVRDRDRIYGVILSVGSSSDGRGKGITAPNAAGQERALKACLELGGIDPRSISLIEAHGTSTPVGDATELKVLDAFFRTSGQPRGSLGVGSVKSQIGHLKAAAGSAGIIKAILSVYHKTLPPTANVRNPNPCIDWNSSPLFLITEPKPWEPENGYPRRAGVSAFGFGGTNFHVVVQEHVPDLRVVTGRKSVAATVAPPLPTWPKPPQMEVQGNAWLIGGENPNDITEKITALLTQLTQENSPRVLTDLRSKAAANKIRCGFAAHNSDTVIQKLQLIKEGITDPAKRSFFPARGIHYAEADNARAKSGIAFIFPGQGSQYPYMLRDLAERFPIVAATFGEADEILASRGLPTVTKIVFPGLDSATPQELGDAMKDTQLLQPMILTANIAIFRLLGEMGIHPAAVAGHSLGEYAACVAAGVFSFEDALQAVAVRGREMARVSIADPGLMMSIPADARLVEEVLAEVDGYVVAANKNSPKQTVISGETAAVKKAGELFMARGLEGALIPVSAAFHSGVVAPAREPFMKTLERLTVNPPSIPVLSNVTGDYYPVGPAAPTKILDLLGKQFAAPVEWVKSLRRLYSEGIRIFLECGPKRVMTNLTLDTLSADVLALPTNHPKKGGIGQLMETLAALTAEGISVDFDAGEKRKQQESARLIKAELRVVDAPQASPIPATIVQHAPELLGDLLDPEIREIAIKKEFHRYLEIQGEPIRALIKTGFKSFVENVLPMERTVKTVQSEGMDFAPAVVSGIAAGLPSDVRFPFDRDTLDDLILGRNFIKKVTDHNRRLMLEKNVERLVKGPLGEAELQVVDDLSGVIQLAGFFSENDAIDEYGLDERLVRAMDVTTRLAVAAGIEALRDAGIPLMRQVRITSTGAELPDSWALPPDLRAETGIIFASAFPGMASLVDEVTRETAARFGSGAKNRLIDFYTGLIQRVADDSERERITRWFADEFAQMSPADSQEHLYTFNRDFLLRVMSMAQGQLAQLIKAQGPNTHVDAACAGTTQAVVLARDWIRTGQAKRVIIIAADDVAGKSLFPWIGSGFLAMGAATTNGNVSEAALPFDDRRNGLILGSAAVGIVLENGDLVKKRGMEPIASIEAAVTANSGFHGTRLDVEHISTVMEKMIAKWEEQTGISRENLASDMFFMSHETYSPKRGGSSAAEIKALRNTFGDLARKIPITNTKGFTGHTMGVGVEDVVALRCLQKGLLPPIPNLKHPDPDFADMTLSRGGSCNATYALRLAAGFGSQIVMALYKSLCREENRISDLNSHRDWLKKMTGYADPVISVENRTLKVAERSVEKIAADPSVEQVRTVAASEPASRPAEMSLPSEAIRSRILSLLSEKTGYPAEMLDTALDLEADLGIDTVKQAEFISEVREAFDIPRIDGLKIAEFPTIEHIINFVHEHTMKDGEEPVQETTSVDTNSIREKVLELLSAKTGYPADMLDTELDLEADLGIDTVKQAEFISEVRDAFNIPRIEGLKIADFPTINHIIGFVAEKSQSALPQVVSKPLDDSAEDVPSSGQEIHMFETRLVALGNIRTITAPPADEVIVIGGPEDFSTRIAEAMKSHGYSAVTTLTDVTSLEQFSGKKIGIIDLQALRPNDTSMRDSFALFLASATAFENGPAFFISVVSEDGAYGFNQPSDLGYIPGAVAGAAKSFAKEYPDSLVRVLDVHPELSPEKVSEQVVRSITHDFPVEIGIDDKGSVHAVRCVPAEAVSENTGIRHGDVVLVSGGAKGITAECLRILAEGNALTVVILGRTELSERSGQLAEFSPDRWQAEKSRIVERLKRTQAAVTPVMVERELFRLQGEAEVFRTISGLKKAGAEVIYRALDIRNAQAVDAAIQNVADTCSRVDVVIHAAGIDNSRALRSKTLDQIETVVAVKIQGMKNILESLNRHEMPPRRIVGFGSVSGRFGNLAQLDYSAGNNGLAHLLRKADRDLDAKASIIDWAPWSEIGMATRGSVQKTLEAAGIDFIPPRRGVELLIQELGRTSGSCEVVAAGRFGPFAPDAFGQQDETSLEERTFAGQQGTVVHSVPGEYLKAAVQLHPAHPLLDHHRINKAAVVPGVGGMEIMRTAAGLGNDIPVAMENVKFHSPIKVFKQDPFEAEVEARRIEDTETGTNSFHTKITSWFIDPRGRKIGAERLHHESTIRLAPDRKPSEVKSEFWPESIWVPREVIYESFFHGPAFMLLEYVQIESQGGGIRFRYRDTPEVDSMFTDRVPAAMEAVFQGGAAFGQETRGIMALPTGIAEVTFFHAGAMPKDGELHCVNVSQDGPEGRTVFTFNGFVRDTEGRVMIEFTGVQMMEAEARESFPAHVFECMESVKEIAAKIDDTEGSLADKFLQPEEAEELGRKATPKRAAEWLAGRIAMKRVVRKIAGLSSQAFPDEREIRIAQDAQGKPFAQIDTMPDDRICDLSLSHSNGLAMAAAVLPNVFGGIGIDVEKIEERTDSWVQDYFTEEEIRSAGSTDSRWLDLTKMWSLKEAALKAMGTGLRFDLRDIAVTGMDEYGSATLEFRNEALRCFETGFGGEVIAKVEEQGNLVVARVLIRS